MKLDISRLVRGLSQKESVNLEADFKKLSFHDQEYEILSPVKIEGSISKVGDDFELKADVNFKYKDNCARCLKELEEELYYDIDVILVKEGNSDEVSESESDVFFYDGEEVDVYELLVHTLEFVMPQKVLCSEDCKGLCAKCGANLNTDACNCNEMDEDEEDYIDPRFAKLKEMFKE